MPFGYPIALELSGRRCVVVGGDDEAERKARGLLDAGAEVTVIAPAVTDGLAALAARGALAHVARAWRRGDLAGATVVVVSHPDEAVRAGVFAEAEDGRILCNAVDDTAHCHFAVPALLRRADLVLAISTGGRAPALAKRIRTRLDVEISPHYAALVDLLAEVRAEAPRTIPFPDWAQAWSDVLGDENALLALLADGRPDDARERIRAHLREATAGGGGPSSAPAQVDATGGAPAAANPATTSAQASGSGRYGA